MNIFINIASYDYDEIDALIQTTGLDHSDSSLS